ncbi:MAG TPA: GyrI-like domain-containing protein, partial [Flavitalea sp.]|nr:GyrI-like domain-containing protein [Flavitalea sp.]
YSSDSQLLLSLKEYVENPAKYYGFEIHIGGVVDTVVVSTKTCSIARNFYPDLKKVFNQLHQFIQEKNLSITHFPIAFINRNRNDSIEIAVAIPVNRISGTQVGIFFQTMPRGRMLIGKYEGPYKNIGNLYAVLRHYLSDYSLTPVALPYEKYLNNKLPESDNALINAEVYFPIY